MHTGILLWTKLKWKFKKNAKNEKKDRNCWLGSTWKALPSLFPPNHPPLSVGDVGKNPGETACCGGRLFPIKMTKLLFYPHFLFQNLWHPRVKKVQKEIRKNEVTYSSYLKTCQVKPIALTNKVTTEFQMTRSCSIPIWLEKKQPLEHSKNIQIN